MNPCTVLQILIAMANVHMDTPANHAKINEAAVFQQSECKAYEEKHKKEKK